MLTRVLIFIKDGVELGPTVGTDVTNPGGKWWVGKQPENIVESWDAWRESAMLTLPILTTQLNGIMLSQVDHVYYLNKIYESKIISDDIFF